MADTPTTAAEAVNETQNSNIIAPGLTDVANQQEPPPLPQLATAVDKDGADAAGTTPTAIELRVTTNIDDDGEMQESNSSTQQPVPVTQTASLLSNGTIAARPKMQRNPVPPPIDTENANRDAENSLRSKLLLEVESAEALSGNTADTDTGDAVAELPADASQGAPAAISNNATPHQQTDPATDGAEPALAHIGVSFNKNRRYRRSMEDAHFHRYDFDGVTGQALMAIFDGHAGRQAAQWCGDNFESVFIELRQANPEISIPELLNNVFVETDRRIAELYKQSGTTVVVCFLQVAEDNTRTLYTANAGDARAVLSRNGQATRLTYDHKGDDKREAQRIAGSGGYVFNGRVNGVLAVTRALGDSTLKPYVISNPFTTETVIEDTDDMLILACDGLWDVCSDQEAVDLVRDEKDPVKASQVLLDYALDNESMDNITTMVFRLPHPPSTPSDTPSPASALPSSSS